MTLPYHVCFVVQDIDSATRQLTDTLGVDWSPIRDGRLEDWPYRIVFSLEGPPFLELIEGSPGSPWDASGGPRFDHLGFWSADVELDKQRLAARGAPIDFDAAEYGRPFTYHRLDTVGGRVELVDTSAQPDFVRTWAVQGAAMAPLDLGAAGTSTTASGSPATAKDDAVSACRGVLIDFLAAIDRGRATDALDLFTSDASFAARGSQLHGREAIAAFLADREAQTHRHTVHVVANDTVRERTDEQLTLTALLLLYERAGDGSFELDRVLNTTQTFRRGPDGWRIAHRATTLVDAS